MRFPTVQFRHLPSNHQIYKRQGKVVGIVSSCEAIISYDLSNKEYCNLGDEGLKMLTLLNISNEMLLTLSTKIAIELKTILRVLDALCLLLINGKICLPSILVNLLQFRLK